jgi:hypothetical protein
MENAGLPKAFIRCKFFTLFLPEIDNRSARAGAFVALYADYPYHECHGYWTLAQ